MENASLDPDFSLNMEALYDCDEEDLQLVHAKLSVINKELLEMGDTKDKGDSPSQPASPALSQRSSMEMEMAVFKASDAVCRD
ncbi:g3322 [Coccomyxa elongata]